MEESTKILALSVEEEVFGIDVLQVQEILKLKPVTPVPSSPDYLLGVLNLRGKIVPVLNLGVKLKLREPTLTEDSCIVVVESESRDLLGLVVDKVLDVTLVSQEGFNNTLPSPLLKGVGQLEDETLVSVLDIEKLFEARA